MPPLRFLHAAGLDPDAILPTPPAGQADLFASAQIAAVRRLVTQAIELEVGFVLVTPASEAGPSLPSEAALRSEFDRLLERGITVFLAVGSRDSGWERIANRGSNVVLLPPGSFAPVSDEEGRPAATLHCLERPTLTERRTPAGPEDSLELAVAPRLAATDLADVAAVAHDYVALGRGPRTAVSLAGGFGHAPGPLQAREATESGPHGATLVVLEPGGETRVEFIPTAPVRFESLKVAAKPSDVIEDLAMRMAERLGMLKPEAGEAAWVVRWQVEAADSLDEMLSTPSGRSDLVGLLPEKLGDVSIVHQVLPRPELAHLVPGDSFTTAFAVALQEYAASLTDATRRLALVGVAEGAAHRDRLARLLASVDATLVIGNARRLGLALAAAADGSDD